MLRYLGWSSGFITRPPKPTTLPFRSLIGNMSLSLKTSNSLLSLFFLAKPALIRISSVMPLPNISLESASQDLLAYPKENFLQTSLEIFLSFSM